MSRPPFCQITAVLNLPVKIVPYIKLIASLISLAHLQFVLSVWLCAHYKFLYFYYYYYYCIWYFLVAETIVETGCSVDNVAHHELLVYFLGTVKFLSGNSAVIKTLAGKQYLTSLSQVLASVNSTVSCHSLTHLLIYFIRRCYLCLLCLCGCLEESEVYHKNISYHRVNYTSHHELSVLQPSNYFKYHTCLVILVGVPSATALLHCSMLWTLLYVLSVTQECLTMAWLKSCTMTYTGSMWQIKSNINLASSCTDDNMAAAWWTVAQLSPILQSQISHTAIDGSTMTLALHCWPPSISCAESNGLELCPTTSVHGSTISHSNIGCYMVTEES